MKLTHSQLIQIIKEELGAALGQTGSNDKTLADRAIARAQSSSGRTTVSDEEMGALNRLSAKNPGSAPYRLAGKTLMPTGTPLNEIRVDKKGYGKNKEDRIAISQTYNSVIKGKNLENLKEQFPRTYKREISNDYGINLNDYTIVGGPTVSSSSITTHISVEMEKKKSKD